MSTVPPRLARWLLSVTPLARRRPDVVGDLQELFEMRAVKVGRRAAARRYVSDVLSLWAPLRFAATPPNPPPHPPIGWRTRMEQLLFDVRYACRRMRAAPGATALALLTIALGVGANTAIFSVSDAVLFRSLPFHEPDRIVKVSETEPKQPDRRISVSFPTFNAWRECRDVFDALATWKSGAAIVVEREPEQAAVDLISTDYFAVYGIQPAYGRAFSDADMEAGAAPVVILSDAFWRKYFNGDPNALGRALHLSDSAPTIVGVLPADFPDKTPLYRPLQPGGIAGSAFARQFPIIGRVRRGVSLEQVGARLQPISRQHAVTDKDRRTIGVAVEPYSAGTIRYARPTLRILSGAALFVLLIACVNVGGLMFARGAARSREIAVRASLGAARTRLVRQLLVESGLLGVSGGAVGALLAWIGLDVIVAAVPLTLPSTARPEIDIRVLAFALVVSIACGVLFGLVPALRLSRPDLVSGLGAGSRTGAPLPKMVSRGLIGAEIALTLVLVSGASLMIRSLMRLYGVDKGFSPDGVITMEAAPIRGDDATYRRYYQDVLDRLRSVPGVQAAGASDTFPLGPMRAMTSATPVGEPDAKRRGIVVTTVMPGFFDAMSIPLQAGRAIGAQDRAGTLKVAVLNESAARTLFPSVPAVGRRLQIDRDVLEIVGIASDVRSKDLASEPEAELYRAYAQSVPATTLEGRTVGRRLTLIARVAGDPRRFASTLRQQAQATGEPALVQRMRTLDDWIGDSAKTTRQRTTLLGLLGALGLTLAIIGVFGMTSYAVSQRTREIGVRMALGATAADVMRAVGSGVAVAIAIGVITGLLATLWTSRAIASFLYEVKPADPISLVTSAATLIVAAAIAAWLPARRALRVDPIQALRVE